MAIIESNVADVVPWKRMRYVMIALQTTAVAFSYAAKGVMSIAVVAMTDSTANANFETFEWDLTTRSNILSSFYWGYALCQLPAGALLQKYGVRWPLFFSVLITGAISLVIPFVAYSWDWGGVCAVRILMGCIQTVLMPSIGALVTVWAIPTEYGRLGAICISGLQISNILALPIGGALASSSGGWPSIFYCFAGLCFAWCILWFFLGFDSPDRHPYISEQEKRFILSYYKEKVTHSFQTPWLKILTSIPLWALTISACTYNWGYNVIVVETPTYMKDILHYNIQENGALSATPYVVMVILGVFNGWSSDFLISKNILSQKWTRKLYNTIGLAGPMLTMIGLGYVGEGEKDIAVALLIISCGLNAAVFSGFLVNPMELTHNFIAPVMALNSFAASCFALVVPLIVPIIITNETSEEDWQTLFWITGAIYLTGSLVFLFFSSSELQQWDKVNISGTREVDE